MISDTKIDSHGLRVSRIRIVALVFVFWWFAAAVVFVVNLVMGRGLRLVFLQALVHSLITAAFLVHPAAARFFFGMPKPHRLAFTGVFFFFILGQLLGNSPATFPFSSWNMYSNEIHTKYIQFYQYVGRDVSGREIPLNATHYFLALQSSRFHDKLRNLMNAVMPEGTGDSESNFIRHHAPIRRPARDFSSEENTHTRTEHEKTERLNGLLKALGTAHNKRHPFERLTSIEVYFCRQEIDRSPLGPVQREKVWAVDL